MELFGGNDAKIGLLSGMDSVDYGFINSISYSFKINGEPVGYVQPKRGIWQGDQLSPFLFVICAEGQLALLMKEAVRGKWTRVCRDAPMIHHLLFMDDSFLFAHGTLEECGNIKRVLRTYEVASGQAVNLIKSCVSFSSNLKDIDQQLLVDFLGVQRVAFHDRYLGLLVCICKPKEETFAYVKDRLWKKLDGWRGCILSSAGKNVLVKTVAQALPMYTIQCFLLPKTFCEELNMMTAKFWWSGDPGKRKVHWLNWRLLCKPKNEGGFGFREFYAFNIAMLSKQTWRFVQGTESLVYRMFKAKYFSTTDFLNAPVKANASYCWKSIAATRNVICKGLRWQIGRR